MMARIAYLMIFLAISMVFADDATKAPAKPVVAVFDLNGSMGEQPTDDAAALFGPQAPWLRDMVTRMDKAAEDPDVKAVVILTDDASFGWAQAEELRESMQVVRKAGKAVYGHGDWLDMQQYVLLSGASRISAKHVIRSSW